MTISDKHMRKAKKKMTGKLLYLEREREILFYLVLGIKMIYKITKY